MTEIYQTTLTLGIKRAPEFERKGLAQFAVNVGTKCSHDCLYCSTGAMVRMHSSFKQAGRNPFDFGYAIVDPNTPERVARDARRIKKRGMVQLCTIVDAWAPEAQEHNLGRRCLEAILAEPDWTVRILTKNAAVRQDFEFIQRHRDRVLVGLSLTGTSEKEAALGIVERNASPISARMEALQEAHRLGLHTYGMLCPIMPSICDDEKTIGELIEFCLACGVEEIFAESINARGPGLRLVEEALRNHGFQAEADAINRIRKHTAWSSFTVVLLDRLQQAMREKGALDKLRFMLYPSRLSPGDEQRIRQNDAGVKWLGKDGAQE